jgi:large subunit ribosomal protein L11
MKPIKTILKLQIPAGQANPAPPVGPALGQHGVSIQDFCNQFNEATKNMAGDIIPAEITIYEDRSFSFRLKTPPASALLKKAAGLEKGASSHRGGKIGRVTRADLRQIAEKKLPDLNTDDLNQAMKIIEGTAKSMGLEIVD